MAKKRGREAARLEIEVDGGAKKEMRWDDSCDCADNLLEK